eukprot:sb/3467537/
MGKFEWWIAKPLLLCPSLHFSVSQHNTNGTPRTVVFLFHSPKMILKSKISESKTKTWHLRSAKAFLFNIKIYIFEWHLLELMSLTRRMLVLNRSRLTAPALLDCCRAMSTAEGTPPRTLITGSLGQLGLTLAKEMRQRYGKERVVCTDIRKPPKTVLQSGPYRYANILNKGGLEEILVENRIDQHWPKALPFPALFEQNNIDPVSQGLASLFLSSLSLSLSFSISLSLSPSLLPSIKRSRYDRRSRPCMRGPKKTKGTLAFFSPRILISITLIFWHNICVGTHSRNPEFQPSG